MKHLLNTESLTKEDVYSIFTKEDISLANKILVNYFAETSTRTRCSFEAAMYKLGGKVININRNESSASIKGESFNDTIRMLENYGDAIVIRSSQTKAAENAAKISSVPVINAGDGDNEHPTQALLDYYTITQTFKDLSNLKVMFVGDLKRSRTVHSLMNLLRKYDTRLVFVSDEKYGLNKECLKKEDCVVYSKTLAGSLFEEHKPDIVYMTRFQNERNIFGTYGEYDSHYKLIKNYVLTEENISHLGNAKIMHALPRNQEIPEFFDKDPRAMYMQQAKNAVLVRKKILGWIFS